MISLAEFTEYVCLRLILLHDHLSAIASQILCKLLSVVIFIIPGRGGVVILRVVNLSPIPIAHHSSTTKIYRSYSNGEDKISKSIYGRWVEVLTIQPLSAAGSSDGCSCHRSSGTDRHCHPMPEYELNT